MRLSSRYIFFVTQSSAATGGVDGDGVGVGETDGVGVGEIDDEGETDGITDPEGEGFGDTHATTNVVEQAIGSSTTKIGALDGDPTGVGVGVGVGKDVTVGFRTI